MGEPFKTADVGSSIKDNEGSSMVKRKRQSNFILKEKMELFTIISEKYKDILENKATDKCSAYEKDKCWDKVESNFNAVTSTGIFRDKDCLKRCYENRKREVRKLKAKEKQERMKTGGGTPEKIVLDAADEVLLQIMNLKSVVGLENLYDSDSIIDKLVRQDLRKDDDKEYWFNNKNIEEDSPSFKKANDFKKPKHPALTPSYLSEKSMQCVQENILQDVGNTTYKVDSLVEEQNPGEKHRNSSSAEVQTAGGGCNPKKGVARGKVQRTHVPNRRPGIQILASSHIAKKYDELLDLRKVLLEKQIALANEDLIFQRAKNRLELEVLNLKVAKEKNKYA